MPPDAKVRAAGEPGEAGEPDAPGPDAGARTDRFHGSLGAPIALAGVGFAFGALAVFAWGPGAGPLGNDPVARLAAPAIALIAAFGLWSWHWYDRLVVGPEGLGGRLAGATLAWDGIARVTARWQAPEATAWGSWRLEVELADGRLRRIDLGSLARSDHGRPYGDEALDSIERFRAVRRVGRP